MTKAIEDKQIAILRHLRAAGLPADSWKMIRLCEKAGINCNRLARAFFQGAFKE